MITSYILLFILLLFSFFFSGTETAVTAASTPILYEKEKSGDKKAKTLNKLRRKSELLIGSLLLGNNVVNIAITAISTSLMIHYFGDYYGVLIATFGVSVVVLIFSEIMPKTCALQSPTNFALFVTTPLKWFVQLSSPVVVFFNWIVQSSMRFLHIKKNKKSSEKEIRAELRGAIELKTTTSLSSEKYMLKSVLDLSDVTVGDIMQHRSELLTLNAHLPTEEIIEIASNAPYSRIPVWTGRRDNIIGILHAKTLLRLLNETYQRKKHRIHLDEALSKPWFVLESTSLLDQLHAFKKRREHFALVVDEYGALQGCVTLEDLLEEIVGDIADETDDQTEAALPVQRTAKGAYRLEGTATIRDINRRFKWNLSDENASTLGGFIMYETERIPDVGQTFEIDGYTFTIIRKSHHALSLIDVTPPAKAE